MKSKFKYANYVQSISKDQSKHSWLFWYIRLMIGGFRGGDSSGPAQPHGRDDPHPPPPLVLHQLHPVDQVPRVRRRRGEECNLQDVFLRGNYGPRVPQVAGRNNILIKYAIFITIYSLIILHFFSVYPTFPRPFFSVPKISPLCNF